MSHVILTGGTVPFSSSPSPANNFGQHERAWMAGSVTRTDVLAMIVSVMKLNRQNLSFVYSGDRDAIASGRVSILVNGGGQQPCSRNLASPSRSLAAGSMTPERIAPRPWLAQLALPPVTGRMKKPIRCSWNHHPAETLVSTINDW
jgi:hypothetical protein